MSTIRHLFNQQRSIDRRIEKVIDYGATDQKRLGAEIEEYEVTPSVERGMRRILENFDEGARGGEVAEIGVWVSGYYGSGKSSFTKYLGFSLDRSRKLGEVPFVEHLAERIHSGALSAQLRTVAKRHKTAVFMVDLGTDQLADSASESVTNVLYWNVLKQLGFSKEKKVAELELRLFRDDKLDAFRQAYAVRYPGKEPWDEIHNDSSLAVVRASTLVGGFYPDTYPEPSVFRSLETQPVQSVGDLAGKMIDLILRRRQCDNIIFFVDEVGQYVAPRQELILNLDGLARAFKEQGKGHVWFVATAQQTLKEISDKAALNSPELVKLQDRFPITVDLEASDIRDITAKRLLTKTNEGRAQLEALWKAHGELLRMHTHLTDWPGGRRTLEVAEFVDLYPFLPARFDVVLDLIRALSRRTGGTGLRSAIRLVQDLLVDTSRMLPKGTAPLADRPIGSLASIDDVYDTLRHDLHKEHPQAVEGVDKIAKHPDFKGDPWAVRAAKAVAALQPLENHPRTAANIASLLYGELGAPGNADAVQKALNRLVDAREFGLVELRADLAGQSGTGYVFLSNEVQPIQKRRDEHIPAQAEMNAARLAALAGLFEPVPETKVDGIKTVKAEVRLGKSLVAGPGNDILFRLEEVAPEDLVARADALVSETQSNSSLQSTVFWLFARPSEVDDHVRDVCRSEFIQTESTRGKERDKSLHADVGRFLRSEERRAQRAKEAVRADYQHVFLKGFFVFRGQRRPVEELGSTVTSGAAAFLQEVAGKVFRDFSLVKKTITADAAQRFLGVDRPSANMPKELDPLGFFATKSGRTSINVGHPALAGALLAFRALVAASGTGRLQGSTVLDYFFAAPYGWSKDATRYIFAALLMAGEIELHTGDGVLRTAGPKALEAIRNTQNFSRAGIAPRGQPVPLAALDRASRRLEEMFGGEVLPLEDQVSRAVRSQFPTVMERAGSLPDRLRLLGLQGEKRAREFLQACADLLKEDAGGAASLLGGVESTIPAEEKWASGVAKILDENGEQDIREARTLLARLNELSELFPAVGDILALPAAATMGEILASDTFSQRMADLRGASRVLGAAVRAFYRQERAALLAARDEASQRLQQRPLWSKVPENERNEIGNELLAAAAGLREEPQDALASLQRVLTRRIGLADLEERLARKTDASAAAVAKEYARDARPEPPFQVSGIEEPYHAGEAPAKAPEPVAMSQLLPAGPLASVDDVEQWITKLRADLIERVQLGPIVLTVGR